MAYRDNLTAEQVKALYTPSADAAAIKARLAALRVVNPRATMTDAVSDLVSETSGRRLRYVNGKLCDVQP